MNSTEAKAGLKTFLVLSFLVVGAYSLLTGGQTGYQLFLRAQEQDPTPQNIRLLALKPQSAIITWTTAKETFGFLTFGPGQNLGRTTPPEEQKVVVHVAVLENLFPGTTYFYKIGVNKTLFGQPPDNQPHSFTTPHD